MNLKDSIIEELEFKANIDSKMLDSFEKISVEQHKRRALASALVDYPSLMGQLYEYMQEHEITVCDYVERSHTMHTKPYWRFEADKATLYCNY